MSEGLAELRRECADLYRMVEAMRALVTDERAARHYQTGSEKFLDYFEQVASATLKCLQDGSMVTAGGSAELDARTTLRNLGGQWALLHEYVKPILDAHTLRLPAPFLELVRKQLRALHGCAGADVAFEASAPFMYAQRVQQDLREQGAKLRTILAHYHAPEFPAMLALIALPYSQGSSLFANVVLYHEVGHFVGQTAPSVQDAMEDELREIGSRLPTDLNLAARAWITDFLRTWWQELFADLLAVLLIGPAFVFSFLDALRVLGLLDGGAFFNFTRHHPSPYFRLCQQHRLLHELGWLALIPDPSASVLSRTVSLHGSGPLHTISGVGIPQEVEPAFINALVRMLETMLPAIERQAKEASGDRGRPPAEYVSQARAIQECLSHALVPSIALDAADDPDRFVTLLNAAYFFNSNDLGSLFQYVPKLDSSRLGHRAWLSSRVELWTLKAIENLLVDEKGLVIHGGTGPPRDPEAH